MPLITPRHGDIAYGDGTEAERAARDDRRAGRRGARRTRPNTVVGVNYYLDELTRREFVRASEAALTEARSARRLAGANVIVAAVAVIIAVAVPVITNALAADPPIVAPCTVVEDDRQRPGIVRRTLTRSASTLKLRFSAEDVARRPLPSRLLSAVPAPHLNP